MTQDEYSVRIEMLKRKRDTALARVNVLEAALKPFVEYWQARLSGSGLYSDPILVVMTNEIVIYSIRSTDFYRAKSALHSGKKAQ